MGATMNTSRKMVALLGATTVVAGMALLAIPRGAASRAAQGNEPAPAYHSQVPQGALPQTMDPASFNNPLVQNAYAVAAKVKRVLYQQPCFCHCDRSIGHESLLDCYVGKHAAVCDVCMKEALYAYEQTLKKKTATQIRDGILHGEWQQVDTSKYESYPAKQ
jgi:hypothetical protein